MPLRPFLPAAAAAVLLAAAVSGCGGSDPADTTGAGIGGALAAPINLADCTDWKQASAQERLGTIGQIRRFVGEPIAGTGERGGVLTDEQAYNLFQNTCANEYARGFKLYKLYSRAAAFSGQ